jgi:hypothetical protein
VTYRHAIMNRRANFNNATPQWAVASDMNARSTEMLVHSKETTGAVGNRVNEENRERRLTRTNMRLDGSGTQATRHVQAGSGEAQQR